MAILFNVLAKKESWSLGLYDCQKAVFGNDNEVWAHPSNNCEDINIGLANSWQHLIATKSQDNLKIYLNGILIDSKNGLATNCSNLILAEDIGDLFIGTDFTGKIDDIIIFDRELTLSEVNQLFSQSACCEE